MPAEWQGWWRYSHPPSYDPPPKKQQKTLTITTPKNDKTQNKFKRLQPNMNKNREKPYVPILSNKLANKILELAGDSTCSFGSHKCSVYSGNFIKKTKEEIKSSSEEKKNPQVNLGSKSTKK